jgi:hypothetical protein
LPIFFFLVFVFSTIVQSFGAFILFKFVINNYKNLITKWSPMQRFALMFFGLAFGVKIILQLGSNIPAVNQFAFGFRNVVIAYLHLVLLMCVATFLINEILATKIFILSKKLLLGFKLLLLGIFLNELVLGSMGIFSIKYISIPFAKEALLLISLLMFFAIFWMFIHLKRRAES